MDKVMCEMVVIDRANSGFWAAETKPCPNRAKFLVVAQGWTKKMCGTHGNPYDREFRIMGRFGLKSVTLLAPQ